MKKEIYRADTRGGADHGWLKTRHSFSFADYYDPSRMGFGALRVLNDDQIAPASGFGKHPHSNMEIITIPLEGAVTHEDSLGQPAGATPTALLAGNRGVVKSGEVQIMSAGSGVVHSEENKDPEKWLKLLQIWVETDPKYLDIAPRYKQKTFSLGERSNAWQLLVSPSEQSDPLRPSSAEARLDIMQDAWIFRVNLDNGKTLSYELRNVLRNTLRNKAGVFLFVIEGKITVVDETLNRRDAIALTEGEKVEIEAEAASDILLIEVPL